jgi:hypothetical protein
MNDNVTAIPTVEQDKNIAQLETLKRNLDTIIETNKVIAKIRRESFLAYIAQGFTTEQALQLCK